jgi:hypothetical protein
VQVKLISNIQMLSLFLSINYHFCACDHALQLETDWRYVHTPETASQ